MGNSSVEQAAPSRIIAEGTLGRRNIGFIGPNSEREAYHAKDLGNEEYKSRSDIESHCMDDRIESLGIQLAGNRAVTEAAASYMEPSCEAVPLSRQIERSVHELLAMGRTPNFHEGCAAIAVLAGGQALRYMSDQANREMVMGLADARLRLLGIDTISPNDYEIAFDAAAENLSKDALWDVTPEQIMEIAKQSGAGFDLTGSEHSAVGARWDVSEYTFDNAAFRRDHQSDEGRPMGALSVTLGAYKKQLEEDGFYSEDVVQKMFRATLYAVAVLKVAQKENAPDIIVG